MLPDIKELELLKYKRPAGSYTEIIMIQKYIDVLPGIYQDKYGNRITRVGLPTESDTMFSCHTDTMHKTPGIQNIMYDDVKKELFVNHGECLGVDDGAGIIVMIEMIKSGVPGLYVFHREEEIGGRGSSWIEDKTPELFEGIQRCIAFDRKGTSSVITHQSFERCCSDDFAQELGFMLTGYWFNDDTGSFTDSANYMEHIPECTNLSIGYDSEHTRLETLWVPHLIQMIDDCCTLDWESLPTVRDPSVTEYLDWSAGYYDRWDNKYYDEANEFNELSGYSNTLKYGTQEDKGHTTYVDHEVQGSAAPDFYEIDNLQEQYEWVYDYPEEATLMLRNFIQNYQRKEEVA